MTDNKPVSLGEQPHDPTHCHRGGRPHLGPCIEPPDSKLIAELATVMHTANDGATCNCDIREEFEVSAEAAVKFLIKQRRLVPDGAGETVNCCGCPVRYTIARIEEHTRECGIVHEEWTIREFGGD